MTKYFFCSALMLCSALLLGNSARGQDQIRPVKLTNWLLQSSAVVTAGGEELSSAGYQDRARDFWWPVTVPGTVLSGLVANKVYPDPYTGMNNMLIPDASDSFNHE